MCVFSYTFFDYSKADDGWTESRLTAGAATIAHIEYYPRAGYLTRHITGGKFIGVRADGSEVALATITKTPTLSWNAVSVSVSDGPQDVVSVKYESAPGSYGNIAEIGLYRAC